MRSWRSCEAIVLALGTLIAACGSNGGDGGSGGSAGNVNSGGNGGSGATGGGDAGGGGQGDDLTVDPVTLDRGQFPDIKCQFVGIDEQGRATVIWHDSTGYLFARYLPSLGWQDPEAVPVHDYAVWVGDRQGHIYALLIDDRFFGYEPDSGWSELDPLPHIDGVVWNLRADDDGDILALGADYSGPSIDRLMAVFYHPSSGWDAPMELLVSQSDDDPSPDDDQLTMAGTGRAFAGWLGQPAPSTFEMRIATVTEQGWTAIEAIGPAGYGGSPLVRASADGHALATWGEVNAAQGAWFNPTTGTWGTPEPISSSPGTGAVVSDANTALAYWAEPHPDYPGARNLFASAYEPNSGWQQLGQLSLESPEFGEIILDSAALTPDVDVELDAQGDGVLVIHPANLALFVAPYLRAGTVGSVILADNADSVFAEEGHTPTQSYGIATCDLAMNDQGDAVTAWSVSEVSGPDILRATVIE